MILYVLFSNIFSSIYGFLEKRNNNVHIALKIFHPQYKVLWSYFHVNKYIHVIFINWLIPIVYFPNAYIYMLSIVNIVETFQSVNISYFT